MVLFYGIFTGLTRKTTLRPREPEDEPSPHRAIGYRVWIEKWIQYPSAKQETPVFA